MTQNQINYWTLQETVRNNKAVETETNRANVARETETNRSNLAREKETHRSNLEKERLNIENSVWNRFFTKWSLEESARHNKAVEQADIRRINMQEKLNENNVKIAQQQNAERYRSNISNEEIAKNNLAEQVRAAKTREAIQMSTLYETGRSNRKQEDLRSQINQETARANRANENIRNRANNIAFLNYSENRRANQAREQELNRSNLANEALRGRDIQNNWNTTLLKLLSDSYQKEKDRRSNQGTTVITTVGRLIGGLK